MIRGSPAGWQYLFAITIIYPNLVRKVRAHCDEDESGAKIATHRLTCINHFHPLLVVYRRLWQSPEWHHIYANLYSIISNLDAEHITV